MKVMICANLLIGDPGVLAMPADVLTKWHEDKIEALAIALEDAREKGAECCIMAGGLFAEGFIPQGLLCDAVEELGAHELPVSWFPLVGEAEDLATRVTVPENVAVLRNPSEKVVDGIRIIHNGSEIEVGLNTRVGAHLLTLGLLEPMGFGDQAKSSYLIVDVDEGKVISVEEESCGLHPFVVRAISIDANSSNSTLMTAVQEIISRENKNSCLHLILRGRIPLNQYINVGKLTQLLNERFFYAEVADECIIDLDDGDLANDVSLLAEFVRSVNADDSLSPVEKSRIIRCGRNALTGKELAE